MNNFIMNFKKISLSGKNCEEKTCGFSGDINKKQREKHSVVECKSKGINIDEYTQKKVKEHSRKGKKIVDAISINNKNLFFLIEFKHLFSDMLSFELVNKNREGRPIYEEFNENSSRADCMLSILNQKFRDTLEYLRKTKINIIETKMVFVYKFCDGKKIANSPNRINKLISNLRKKVTVDENLCNFKIVDYLSFQNNCKEYDLDLNK